MFVKTPEWKSRLCAATEYFSEATGFAWPRIYTSEYWRKFRGEIHAKRRENLSTYIWFNVTGFLLKEKILSFSFVLLL